MKPFKQLQTEAIDKIKFEIFEDKKTKKRYIILTDFEKRLKHFLNQEIARAVKEALGGVRLGKHPYRFEEYGNGAANMKAGWNGKMLENI